ncbi:MAG TPA: ABC transporter permease, partial [Acidobacteriota bacterium]|nr:ABC transporter permease [Acidobacteriota bacterium]
MTWLIQVAGNFLRQLILRRHLVWNFAVRDLKSRYVGSLMGFFWAVVHPLVLLVSYTFVFSLVFRVRDFSPVTDNFAVFLFCGILPWLYFQDTVTRCCTAIIDNSNLIRKTVFPSEILPLAFSISNLVTHLVGLGILLVVLAASQLLSWTAIFLPLLIVPLVVLTLGLGWALAALQVFLRDTAQVMSVLLVFWFWFTPIFYATDRVPEPFRPLILANPLTYIVEGYRALLLAGSEFPINILLVVSAYALAAFVIGGII